MALLARRVFAFVFVLVLVALGDVFALDLVFVLCGVFDLDLVALP